MSFAADVAFGLLTHPLIEIIVVDKIGKMLRHSFMVPSRNQKAALSILNLEWNTAGRCCDNGFALANVSIK